MPDCCIVSSSSFCSLECASVTVNLLRASHIVHSELSPGVRFSLLGTSSAVSSTRRPSVCWAHACSNVVHLCLQELPNVLACTSSWPGAMPWCKRGSKSTAAYWGGPESTSSVNESSGWYVTHWTHDWIWWLMLMTVYVRMYVAVIDAFSIDLYI